MNFISTETRAEACDRLAELAILALSNALGENRSASLLLSGGSTPGPAYERMAKADLDWSRVTTGLVDERWVSKDHPASNEGLIRRTFLDQGAGASTFLPMKLSMEDMAAAAAKLSEDYRSVAVPDLAILGMGPDGHTASWFPDSIGLDDAMSPDAPCSISYIDAEGCAVAGEYPDRMTVTMPVLQNAAEVILLITGEGKRVVFENESLMLPIHTLMKAREGKVTVIWAP